ncbi:hypothetical protein QR680_001839 [Steinernema hermaphroditum]|uniref:G-protein coupled receptors family 2 profile 1 domain-containing protein n=1 Tax=Steinernema hermaphroditum TaxID=289476 RepID=A0AA39LGU7_9BILA|nr:hypothetical protein QR680_001839 [Steinernema hermaphroditum]
MSHIDREKATCEFLQNENYLFPNNDYCDVEFDKSFCWYNVTRGDTLFRQCPFNFCLSIEGCAEVAASLQVQRTCHLNGTWGAPDYGGCLEILHNYKQCFAGFCNSCPDPLRQTVMVVTMCLSVTSVAVLVAALVLFTFFDSLQCRRLSIHKNLATAFVFRFAVLALWNAASTSHWFYDCAEFNQRPLYHIEWMCKCILWFFIYFQGIFIAVLYCFLNSEVQLAVKRQIAKLPYRFLRHTYFETQRTYVPESGTVNTRHGIPMEQLEGNSDSQSQRSTTGEPLAN